MPIQLGRCAFTAACTFTGPRFRIRGTNRVVCCVHARTFQLAFDSPGASEADSAAQLRVPHTPGRSAFSILDVRSTSKGPKE